MKKYLLCLFLCFYMSSFYVMAESIDKNIEQNKLLLIMDKLSKIDDKITKIEMNSKDIKQINLLSDIGNELYLIKNKSLEVDAKITRLENNSKKIDYYNLFFVPIFISCLVWLFTTYIPEKRRTKKFRLKIELNLLRINEQLISILVNVMRYQDNQTQVILSYQDELMSQDINIDIFKVGLQDKTFNSNNYDKKTNSILHPIGKRILSSSDDLNSRIQELYVLSDHLSPSEVMMIENINSSLKKYGIKSSLETDVSYSIDPSITHMAPTMLNLYSYYQQIYNIIYKNNEITDEVFILSVTRWLYLNKRYKDCLKYIKNKRTLDELKSRGDYLDMYVFKCLYHLNVKNKGLDILRRILLNIHNIEQYSSCAFVDVILNDDVKYIFIDVYNEKTYDILNIKAIEYITAKNNHIEHAKKISRHFKLKEDDYLAKVKLT